METSELGLRALRSEGEAAGDPQAEEALWAALEGNGSPELLVGAWLALQCRQVAGSRRGVLLLGPPDDGPYSTAASWPSGPADAAGAAAPAATAPLLEAAERALGERAPVVTLPAEARGEPQALSGAVVAQPLLVGGRLRGVVVLEVTPRPEAELRALLPRLRFGGGWLQALLAGAGSGGSGGARVSKERFETVLGVLAATLEHERFQGAATALATELATELECDRVAVGFLRRGRVRLRALSHSAQFGKKTNLVRAVEAAMDEALDQEATLVYPAPSSELALSTLAHGELARQHGSGAILSVPLVRGDQPCGALTLERPEERPFDPRTVELCEALAALAGPALDSHRREDRWIGTKLAESGVRQLGHLLGPRHVALKLGALIVAGIVLFFSLARGDYRLTADAVLEPAVLRAAVAPFNGFVVEAPVRPGDVVEEGALLGALDDRELRLERLKWQSQHQQSLKQYHQALAERDAAQAAVLQAAVAEARAELDRIEDRLAHTRLLAPFDGVVVSGDLSQQLGAPVEQGQLLFEVAPLEAWRVMLQIDERDIDEVEVGQRGKLLLSSEPGEPLEFEVEKITPVSNAAEGANTFRVEARPLTASARLRPGVEGVAKVEVDRRRLAWIWSHDIVDWLRIRLWAWLP